MGVSTMFDFQLILNILGVSIIISFITAAYFWLSCPHHDLNIPYSVDPVPKK
jgi:hypothetical protein